jgi:hypothetical protein
MPDTRPSRATWTRPLRRTLLVLLLLSASPAEAFGLADVISDFLYYRESLAASGRPRPTATLFLDTGFALADQQFDFGSLDTIAFGGQVGALYGLHDMFLVHGAFDGSGFKQTFEVDGDDFRFRGHSLGGRLSGSLIYLDSRPLRAWLTVGARFASNDDDDADAFWTWQTGPSTTLSWRIDDFLLEPNVGVSFSDTFDRDTKMSIVVGAGFAAKYRGERWRPQVNFAYSRVVRPDVDFEDFVDVGPEVLYAVTPALLLGVGYTYSTPLDRDARFDAHSVTFTVRWTF